MHRPAGRVGLREVAEKAGTSVATASAILSPSRSSTRFSSDTRERVLRVAQELHYHPNAHARALIGHPTQTLGVLFGLERASEAVAQPFILSFLQGIFTAAAEARHNVTLFMEPWHNAGVSAGPVRDRRTDGIIVISPVADSDLISCLDQYEIPAVSIASPVEGNVLPSVDVDNSAGARLATEHLLSLGHTRIAHLEGDQILRSSWDRRAAFLETMARAGIAVPDEYVLPGMYSYSSGRERARRLLSLPQPPTAIFAASDNIAQGVLTVAKERGITVPDQLSVVGFDNLVKTPNFEPPLTTIHQPLQQIGEEATRLLIRRIQGEAISLEPRLFEPTLVLRESTGPPPDM